MAEPGITQTDVLKLNKPDKGYFDWDVPLNENWDKLDQLGAGQLPLMTPLDLTYKLSGAALLGWGLSGDYVDADIYTSLWDLCWAARQRAGDPVQSITVYGATYYVSRDSVTGMYFTTADSYTRAVTGCGSSLGMICELDESTGTKTLRLPIDAWTRKPIIDYDAEGGYDLPGYFVPESLPNIKGSAYNDSGGAITSYYPKKTGSFYGIQNLGAIGWYSKPDTNNSDSYGFSLGFDASRSSSAYQDGAWVQPRAHASYRYYKIGNTIQNQGMIDVGALTSAVSGLETEVSRINTVMGAFWRPPSFARVVGFANGVTYTATEPGFFFCAIGARDNTTESIYINGTLWISSNIGASYYRGYDTVTIPADTGTKCMVQGYTGTDHVITKCWFIPCRQK